MPEGTILVLDPTAKANVSEKEMAPRVDTLEGKVVGFLDNSKPNSNLFQERIEEVLSDRFNFKEVVRRRKPDAASGASQSLIDELAEKCDLVINGVGD
jgi:hypothetical protein